MKKLLFTLALILSSVSSNAQTTLRGDINNDGTVSLLDIMELVDIILHGETIQSYLTCPNDNHPHLIDLGFPSGTKWACCNVEATTPEGYGGYYCWGETEEKSVYNHVTYKYATGEDEDGDGFFDDYHSDTKEYGIWEYLGSDIADTQYDVAHVKWGGKWVMPSQEQTLELIENCTYEWMEVNGVKGLKFTSKINGGSIFLPANGYHHGTNFETDGLFGHYWSSTQHPSYDSAAYGLYFDSENANIGTYGHTFGRSVRPVVTKRKIVE